VVATGLSRANARRQPISVVQGGLRTGTDNLAYQVPISGATVGVASGLVGGGAASQTDYGNMAVPSVWRTNRTQAAARVDALSSGGMDDLEIPAFLRKQAD
ncbi:cell division protein FtsZ, partial [Dysgonomonas mossii]